MKHHVAALAYSRAISAYVEAILQASRAHTSEEEHVRLCAPDLDEEAQRLLGVMVVRLDELHAARREQL